MGQEVKMTGLTEVEKDARRDNKKISRISAFSQKGLTHFCQKVATLDDVLKLALCSQDYCSGKIPAGQYQEMEQQMITKYRVSVSKCF
jgi:hypothetical protein